MIRNGKALVAEQTNGSLINLDPAQELSGANRDSY